MEFYRCCLFVTFVVLTVDQFVGRRGKIKETHDFLMVILASGIARGRVTDRVGPGRSSGGPKGRQAEPHTHHAGER